AVDEQRAAGREGVERDHVIARRDVVLVLLLAAPDLHERGGQLPGRREEEVGALRGHARQLVVLEVAEEGGLGALAGGERLVEAAEAGRLERAGLDGLARRRRRGDEGQDDGRR